MSTTLERAPGGAPETAAAGSGGALRRSADWARRAPLLPALVFTIIITQLPFVATLVISFMNWNAYYPDERGFAGIDNFRRVLTDVNTRHAIWVTIVLTAGVVLISLVLGLLMAWQVRSILRSRHPAVRAVEAIALSLPLFLLLFAGTYVVLSGSDPKAFTEPLSRVDSLYFVVTVFSTVGFGDIAPVAEGARVLVTVQMVGDLLLIGLVLRLFVTAVDRGRRRAAGQEGPPSLTPGG